MNRNAKLLILIAVLALSGIGAAGTLHMMSATDLIPGGGACYGQGYSMMHGWGRGGQTVADPEYMMGPDMMGGPGTSGPGMMGPGFMVGAGMMAGVADALNLTDEQRKNFDAIADESRGRMLDLMRQMRAERFRLQELYYADEPDAAAISKQLRNLSDLRQKMLELQFDSRERLEGALNKDQVAEMKRWRRRWMTGG